jgi:dTDP-4-amino-4,6-dideoxygalactose transaminase
MKSHNPYLIVEEFEERIAEWTGAPYGVAVESCSAAIFLSLMWLKNELGRLNWVSIPKHTYPSTACNIIHAGAKVYFRDDTWDGEYRLQPYDIWDAALRFKKNMYKGGFQCLSFHVKKHLPIGRGGMILCEDKEARDWLRRARFDGRNPIPLKDDVFEQLGYNMYLEPSQAARGIQLFEVLRQKHPEGMPDLVVDEQGYNDLSKFPIYQQ